MKKTIFLYFIFFVTNVLFVTQIYSQGLMAPGGTGAWGNMVYGGIGLISPQPFAGKSISEIKTMTDFTSASDMVISGGFGIGNPAQNVGIQVGINVLDVSQLDLFNLGVKVHRYIRRGISIGIGAENIFIFGTSGTTEAIPSVYLAMTHNFAYIYPSTVFASRFSYSFGGGYGRFSKLTDKDKAKHADRIGTLAFGAVQFRINKNIFYHLEWNGVNLNSGISLRGKLMKIPFSVVLAATNLTPYTSDRVSFLGAVGALYQFRKKQSDKKSIDAIMRRNERFALEANLDQHRLDILASNKISLSDKIDLLENELKLIKDKQPPITYNNNKTDTINYGEPDNKTSLDLNEYDIVKVTKKVDHGYAIEPGNYIVIHSLVKKENAINAVKDYKKINIETKIIYNIDKEIHYVCTQNYPLSERSKALAKSTEQRNLGFKGAWVFTKEWDEEANYFEPIDSLQKTLVVAIDTTSTDSVIAKQNKVVDLSQEKILQMNDKFVLELENLEPGNYLVISAFSVLDNLKKTVQDYKKQGIDAKAAYNENRNMYYIYIFKDIDITKVIEKRKELIGEFNKAWIFQY